MTETHTSLSRRLLLENDRRRGDDKDPRERMVCKAGVSRPLLVFTAGDIEMLEVGSRQSIVTSR
jgi:hypothetical protein